MSKQVSISAAISASAMALFALASLYGLSPDGAAHGAASGPTYSAAATVQ